MSNEILDEIRRVRDEMARECDYDVHKLSKMIGEGTEKLKAEGWKFVTPEPRVRGEPVNGPYALREDPKKRQKTMTRLERAAQLWPLLAFAARNRQILTYDLVSRLTGVPRPAVGDFLGPIHDYCLQQKLPPLTVLVVSEKSGLPGVGFVAAKDFAQAQASVFAYDWCKQPAPSPQVFEKTFEEAENNSASA